AGAAMGTVGKGDGSEETPLLVGPAAELGDIRVEYRPLPAEGADFPAESMARERSAMDERLPPVEFRPIWRSGVDVPAGVWAGDGAAALGPARAEAAARYFSRMGETR
ncbi:MAG: hypothetical protein LIP77_08690, partial [Planctomycetes bacterium]|nr:hypothetical protein [Planctomycetota bacterium]